MVMAKPTRLQLVVLLVVFSFVYVLAHFTIDFLVQRIKVGKVFFDAHDLPFLDRLPPLAPAVRASSRSA